MVNRRYNINHPLIGRYFNNTRIKSTCGVKVTSVYEEIYAEQSVTWCICRIYNEDNEYHFYPTDLINEITEDEWIISCIK